MLCLIALRRRRQAGRSYAPPQVLFHLALVIRCGEGLGQSFWSSNRYGATLGGVLAGIEKRVVAYVLMAGLVAHSEWWRSGDHEFYRRFREQVTQEHLDEMVKTMATVDAIHFIGHAAPAALLFQFARRDQFISEQEALRYWTAASEPKEIRWYDTDHFFNAEARRDRIAWLGERLELSST